MVRTSLNDLMMHDDENEAKPTGIIQDKGDKYADLFIPNMTREPADKENLISEQQKDQTLTDLITCWGKQKDKGYDFESSLLVHLVDSPSI